MKKEHVFIKRALISVSDKTHLDRLVHYLNENKVELVSTGGTKKYIEGLGIPVTAVESITGNPEAFGGRMKSISFQISSSLLFRRNNETDLSEAKKLNIQPIDLVICNLYPFEKHVELKSDEDLLIENIDVGGPLMLRCAAKNYESVTVLSHASDYDQFINFTQKNKLMTDFNYRREQAVKTFKRITHYDMAISDELSKRYLTADIKTENLRYGENPHQKAELILTNNTDSPVQIAKAEFIQGKELSYNNWIDADAAWRVVSDIYHAQNNTKYNCITVVVKHANPCGLAACTAPIESLKEAWNGDSISSFGGIIATSYSVTKEIAEFLIKNFIEVLIAPDFDLEALEIFKTKKNVRLLKTPLREYRQNEMMTKSISGALLKQNEDEASLVVDQFKVVTKSQFSDKHQSLFQFGVLACKHLKSNGVALVGQNANGLVLVGAGMGQPNRLDSLRLLATHRAKNKDFKMKDLVLISDAFFPFSDSIDVCHEVGINAVIQPGGSIKDQEVIARCDEHQIAMAVTGVRHFRH